MWWILNLERPLGSCFGSKIHKPLRPKARLFFLLPQSLSSLVLVPMPEEFPGPQKLPWTENLSARHAADEARGLIVSMPKGLELAVYSWSFHRR